MNIVHYSPLRYPGGKKKLAAFIAKICMDNNVNGHYVEPYAGGSSVAIFLLLEGFVDRITINDKDRSIYAFWHSVLNNTKELCRRIQECEITHENWLAQKAIQDNKKKAKLIDLGFSTLFMNRTNRSGIINGGIIGGVDQEGDYKMDCRFNKSEIITRIQRIAKFKSRIRLYKKDAIQLIEKIQNEAENENIIFYFDPPYYLKASTLYLNHYKDADHREVSERIQEIRGLRWIVSYDNVPEIQELYEGRPRKEYSFSHTAYETRVGNEILFFSDNLITPDIEDYNPVSFKHRRVANEIRIIYKPTKRSKKKKR